MAALLALRTEASGAALMTLVVVLLRYAVPADKILRAVLAR